MSEIHTQRLTTMAGVHVGWVLADKTNELVMIPADDSLYRSMAQPAYSLGRCHDAIICNLNRSFKGSISFADAGIGTAYEITDF